MCLNLCILCFKLYLLKSLEHVLLIITSEYVHSVVQSRMYELFNMKGLLTLRLSDSVLLLTL